MEYGIQLYSVRELARADFDAALKAVAECGFRFVEPAGFFGNSAEAVRGMLDKHGLTVSGTHTGLSEILEDVDACIAFHKTIGCKNIIIPHADLYTREALELFLGQVNQLQPKLAEAGITLGYHNHSKEMYIHGQAGDLFVPYLEILKRTTLKMEMDAYWVYVAGQDPLAMMDRLKDRLFFVHIRDGNRVGENRALGMGTAPTKEVYQKAVEMGIPLVLERDGRQPFAVAEAAYSYRFLTAQENKGE